MKDLPIIFPIALVVIIVVIFFTGVYAISADAVKSQPLGYAASLSVAGTGSASDEDVALETDWYQKAAIWVCPLH
jgi:hypothetical protein